MEIESTPEFGFGFSGYNSATTTNSSEDDVSCSNNWDDWSQGVDWEDFPENHTNDLCGLIDSMMDEDDDLNIDLEFDRTLPAPQQQDMYKSPTTVRDPSEPRASPTTTVSIETTTIPTWGERNNNDSNGVRLVHLLMAAAEALTGSNQNRELVKVILVRLKELVSPNHGTNMERLAAYFTDALQGLLEGSGAQNKHMYTNGNRSHHHRHSDDHHHPMDKLAAFQLLQDMSPYVKFGHFTANQAILEATAHDKRIHIVDYDIMEGIQWASLMQALVSRKDSMPNPHLRITALTRGNNTRKSIGTVHETGRRLIAFAASIGQPFSFHQCRLDPDETFRPSMLKLVKGEVLVINCMLHFPHFSYRASDSVASFLSGARRLNPRLVTLVEEEVGPNSTTNTITRSGSGGGEFVERFMDSLHHYSAVFDSLEAGFPMQSRARALVERVFLGPVIAGTLARIYRARGIRVEEDEVEVGLEAEAKDFEYVGSGGGWGEWMLGMGGYKGVGISFFNHCQAKLLLGLFNDGYKVEEVNNNRLVLGWKSRRIISTSLWTNNSSPCSSSLDSN